MKSEANKNKAPTPVGLQRLVRPVGVPEIKGCPKNCGHSDEEHAAFDIGVYDGEHGTTVPPVECCEDTEHSQELREAWDTGYSVGIANRPNEKS
jgi:hypothetical protein